MGSYVARDAAGTPLMAVRAHDGTVRAFRNACRHRGAQLATGSGCAKALAPVCVAERFGLVFVTQDEPLLSDESLDQLPELIART